MDKAFVAQKVSAQLQKAEAALEAANLEYANLMRVMIEARAETNVSHVSVAGEFDAVAKAMDALNGARASTMDLHNGLWRQAKLLRVPTRALQGLPTSRDHTEVVARDDLTVVNG
jgi:hypothetical protein